MATEAAENQISCSGSCEQWYTGEHVIATTTSAGTLELFFPNDYLQKNNTGYHAMRENHRDNEHVSMLSKRHSNINKRHMYRHLNETLSGSSILSAVVSASSGQGGKDIAL